MRGTPLIALSCLLVACAMSGCSGSRSSESDEGMKAKELTAEQRRQMRVFSEEDKKRRAGSSRDFEGLTVGEVEDMPPVPSLPEEFGRRADRQQLLSHSYLVAREEVINGYAQWVSVPARQNYLMQVWSERLEDRQDRLARVAQERQNINDAMSAKAVKQARWKQQNKQMERQYDELIRQERLRVHEALTEDERWELARTGYIAEE